MGLGILLEPFVKRLYDSELPCRAIGLAVLWGSLGFGLSIWDNQIP